MIILTQETLPLITANWPELQALAKQLDIKAKKKADIVAQLETMLAEDCLWGQCSALACVIDEDKPQPIDEQFEPQVIEKTELETTEEEYKTLDVQYCAHIQELNDLRDLLNCSTELDEKIKLEKEIERLYSTTITLNEQLIKLRKQKLSLEIKSQQKEQKTTSKKQAEIIINNNDPLAQEYSQLMNESVTKNRIRCGIIVGQLCEKYGIKAVPTLLNTSYANCFKHFKAYKAYQIPEIQQLVDEKRVNWSDLREKIKGESVEEWINIAKSLA